MKSLLLGFVLAVPALTSCGNFHALWHDQKLPSGKTVKVTSFMLVWGIEHDERRPGDDCLALEFVSNDPKAKPEVREQEALEVFELIRPTSELWGFTRATLAGFQQTDRKGAFDLFEFKRSPDGSWSYTRTPAAVFANEKQREEGEKSGT